MRTAPGWRSRGRARGFTLLELMVVVMIVAILAAIAVPSVAERFRDRRAQEAAERIATLYRSARMRAMGRGAAVMVRFEEGTFELYEAITPTADGVTTCENLPSSSCLNTNWAAAGERRRLSALNLPARGEYAGVTVSLDQGDPREVCYTPLGRAYTRSDATEAWAPLGGVLTATISREVGLLRTVTVLPNGMTRVVARPRS